MGGEWWGGSGGAGGAAAAAAEEGSVRVAVRARPLLERERLARVRECLAVDAEARTATLGARLPHPPPAPPPPPPASPPPFLLSPATPPPPSFGDEGTLRAPSPAWT